MVETLWSPEGLGDTMSRHFLLQASLSVSILISPVLAIAQQRGAAAPAIQMPMVAPSHAMGMMVPVTTTHISAHATSTPVIHSGNRLSTSGTHVVSGKNLSHTNSAKVPVHSHTVHSTNGVTASGVVNGRTAPLAAYADDTYATPGLGFDYAHYAAVHPLGDHHHFAGGGVVPFVGGGIYLPSGGYYVDGAAPQESVEESQETDANEPVDAAEVAAPEQAPVSTRARTKPYPVPAASPEYIFVRRDGTVFFAVAYSWQNGNLQYVTQDGFRKLASQNTLDLDATTQFNEQRGLVFHSPA